MSASVSKSYDVFLSHGSPDKPWVRTLYERLTSLAVVCYLDEAAIEAGDNFVCNLSQGIGQTSTFVIVVSRDTMGRPWVEHEWTSFMATHGPRNRIIPVLLDDVELPPFLRPFQVIRAIDRNAEAVAAKIARALGKGMPSASVSAASAPYTGQQLLFTIASVESIESIESAGSGGSVESADGDDGVADSSGQLVVTSADGTRRMVTAPWRQGHAFEIALRDFERWTREPSLTDDARARLVHVAQTVGAALFDVLFSDEALQTTFTRATAPGTRAVVTILSDDDVLLSLPWELLFHDSRFLVRDGVLDVVRSTTGPVQFETQLTPPSDSFTVVTHIAAPEGSALSYEAESFRITHALTDHCPQTATELGTLDDLVATVTRAKPDGIHFSGHGAPGELVFENDEGYEDRVAIARLVTELRREGSGALPPFFFLASCHGNTPARPEEGKSGSSSSAAQLHREGVTEVVGYYGPIADELSTRAEEALYAAIAAGEPTRLAVAKARAALQRTFDGDAQHRPATVPRELASQGGEASAQSLPLEDQDAEHIHEVLIERAGLVAKSSTTARAASTSSAVSPAMGNATPFAWAQLVLYRRGPEYPLGTPASGEKLRQREAALKRTYRDVADRAFLATGFIGRRRELHQLRRRRKRGDRVFVLQGLGGLGKTTLAGHLLPSLADSASTVTIWCRRSEGERDQAEALVGQLLHYARARFGASFEQVVSHVDHTAGDDATRRFATFLQVILQQQPGVPLVVYFDNLESLLQGPESVSLETAPDPEAFGEWRSEGLQRLWRVVVDLTGAVDNLYVVASCRYRNDDLKTGLLPVSPLAEADLFRLMAWFPSLRRLSTRTRARLARRLSGHPRAVEFLEALVAASMAAWEDTNGEWTAPASSDDEGVEREWKELLEPVLPTVQQRIWSDLLLAALWDRVLDVKAQRMLFRMTLLRRPWDDGVLLHLGEPEDDAEATRQTARRLAATSLLEQTSLTVTTREGQARRPFHTIHAATAAFVKSRFGSADDLVVATHQRVGTHLEAQAPTSSDLSVDLEAGYHLFEAGEYDRAYELLGSASDQLHLWGRLREAVQVLVPLLAEPVKARMRRSVVARLFGTIGLAYAALGETRRAIEYHEQTLVISRETRDRSAEAQTLANLGTGYAALGEIVRAVEHLEQALVIAREVKDGRAELKILGNLGIAYAIQGETRRAMEYLERALAVSRALRDRRAEGQTLGNLGNTYGALDETSRAIEHHKQALVISRELHDLRAEGQDLTNLGNAYSALGEHLSAVAHYEQALVISRKSGDRRAEGQVLGNLGNIYLILGETQRAVDLYKQGLAIGRETSDPQIINTCEKGLKLCAELS